MGRGAAGREVGRGGSGGSSGVEGRRPGVTRV